MDEMPEEVNYNDFYMDCVRKDYEESSDSDDCFDEILSVKDILMRKIEFALSDLEDQKEQKKKTLILRTSFDPSHFQLKYHSRMTSKLERDVNCLRQVYDLLENDKKSTKREMFYEFKALYEVQKNMDNSIKSICELLDEKRENLNIYATGKGLLRGAISFLTDRTGVIDGRIQTVLVSDSLTTSDLICNADFLLIVEKDTTFQKLLDENFQTLFPRGILVTAKGYPDIATRNVVKFIADKRRLPVFGLFDADPHGIEIYLTYKYGSQVTKAEGRDAFVPSIQWIGLRPSDFDNFPLCTSHCLPLTRMDHVKIERLIPRAIRLGEHQTVRELDWMLQKKFKLELESINMCGKEFMSRYLIAPRIIIEEQPWCPPPITTTTSEDVQINEEVPFRSTSITEDVRFNEEIPWNISSRPSEDVQLMAEDAWRPTSISEDVWNTREEPWHQATATASEDVRFNSDESDEEMISEMLQEMNNNNA